MLAELHARLSVNPYRLCNPADRALPDIGSHPTAPGDLHGPGQRDRSGLLRFHRLIVTRAAHPPGFLLILWPASPLRRVLLHIPGALLPTRPARGLRLRYLEFFVVLCPDRPVRPLVFSTRFCFQHVFSIFRTGAERDRGRICIPFARLCRSGRRSIFVFSRSRIMQTLTIVYFRFQAPSIIPVLLKTSFS